AVARHVDEGERAALEENQLLGAARRMRRARERLAPGQRIDQARLADVGASGERDLDTFFSRQARKRGCGKHEPPFAREHQATVFDLFRGKRWVDHTFSGRCPMRSMAPALLVLAVSATTALAQQPAACPGDVVAVDTSVLTSPYVHIRLGAHEGYFLLDTGATYSTVDAKIFGITPGTKATLEGSSFPTITGGTFAAGDLSPFT